MPITINFAKIAEQIDTNTLVLTPNSRTQKAIIAGFVEQLSEGQVVYSPNVMSFAQWQDYLWSELSFLKPMPNRVGSLELKAWLKEQITADENWQLTNSLGVAEKVLDAYKILNQWGLLLKDITSLDTVENQYFIQWIESLECFLTEAELVPRFSLLNRLSQFSADCIEFLPSKILLVGFNQLTPVEDGWFELCKQQGCQISHYYPKRSLLSENRVELSELKQELKFAADLSSELSQSDPECSIGIVVHQLSTHLNLVHQVFSDKFQPEEIYPWQPLEKVKYNVSAGQPLIDMPIIFIAIKVLGLKSTGFDLQTLLLLKNSPFYPYLLS